MVAAALSLRCKTGLAGEPRRDPIGDNRGGCVTDDPYAPPRASCEPEPQRDLLQALKCQSTWRLLGLGLITLGTYYAHYCVRQAGIINRYAGSERIPSAQTTTLIVRSYVSLALFVGYFLVEVDHPLAIASNLSDWAWMILMMAWGFYARRAVNGLAPFPEGDPRRIGRVWTLLFSPLHFNYKINVANQAPLAAQAMA